MNRAQRCRVWMHAWLTENPWSSEDEIWKAARLAGFSSSSFHLGLHRVANQRPHYRNGKWVNAYVPKDKPLL